MTPNRSNIDQMHHVVRRYERARKKIPSVQFTHEISGLDQRLRVNATVFYSTIENYQSVQQLEIGIGTFVSNAAEVQTSGLDLQLDAQPLANLTLSAGLLPLRPADVRCHFAV